MAKAVYMLDTCICSFIMREQPLEVLQKLQDKVIKQHRIVISAVTYAEMCYGVVGKKASPKHKRLVEEFIERVDEILPWDKKAVESSAKVKKQLSDAGTPIGNNDTGIAGHAISQNCILVTNKLREFNRVKGLNVEDWVH